MKKTLVFAIAGMLATGFVSCGQSEEDRIADSVALAADRSADSSTTEHMIDSMTRANALMDSLDKIKKLEDSLMREDSIKKSTQQK
ncbi:MAG TPA: hypothetical protein VI731_05005 [Bacteroidia bacterium]|nr:hypothetical protein [Bacteroidia bacterium]